jgi:ankyrin repeat protein
MRDRGQVSWSPKLLEVLANLEEVTIAISREQFQAFLRRILLSLKVDSQLILVLDGLKDDDWMKSVLLDEVVEVSSGRLNVRRVKCIISSRSSCSPAIHFETCLKIDMDTEVGVRRDISTYATAKFKELSTNFATKKDLEPLARMLSERADGFLWAKLVVGELSRASAPSLDWLKQKIASSPSTIEGLYRQYLKNVNFESRPLLRHLFSWLLASVRPLHLAELQHALIFEASVSQLRPHDQDISQGGDHSLMHQLLKSCTPLIEITTNSTVQLVHHSLKDYLFKRSGSAHESYLAREHVAIARTCLQYLGLEVWSKGIGHFTELLTKKSPESTSTIGDYATTNWFIHYQRAEAHSITLVGVLQRSLESALGAFSGHISCFDKVFPSGTMSAMLRICSRHRLENLGKLYLEMGTDPNTASCSYCKSPLHLAAENGHVALVSLLLRSGASVDPVNYVDGYTALHYAALNGHQEIVRLLLGSGAQVDAVIATSNETPLHLASARGHTEVVKALMNYGAEVNKQRSLSKETPLHLAAAKGYLGVVMCLLEGRMTTKDELELYTTITQQPYYQSWSREFLADPSLHGRYTWEAEERSLAEDDVNKLVSLSKRYADVNLRTKEGLTALELAVMGGHTGVAQFLLSRGAFKTVQSFNGRSLLELATERGHLGTVKFLLEPVMEPELETTADWHSILQLAKRNNQGEVLALLLWKAFGSEFSMTIHYPVVLSTQFSAGNEMKDEPKTEDRLRCRTGDWIRDAWIFSFRRSDIQDMWTNFPYY